MLAQQVEKVCSVNQCEWLVLTEFVGVAPVIRRGDENSFVGTLTNHGAVQIAYCADVNGVHISLRLNDQLPASQRIGIENDSVDATITTRWL